MDKVRGLSAFALFAWGVGLASGALAQDEPDPGAADAKAEPVCELKGENGMVSMLLCPAGLDSEAYAEEGRIACEGRAPCGAWIWTNAEAVPAEAPDAHDKLPKESVREALGIWINDKQELMMLQKETTD